MTSVNLQLYHIQAGTSAGGGWLTEKDCVLTANSLRNTKTQPLPVLLICPKSPGHHANLHGRGFAKCLGIMKFHGTPLCGNVLQCGIPEEALFKHELLYFSENSCWDLRRCVWGGCLGVNESLSAHVMLKGGARVTLTLMLCALDLQKSFWNLNESPPIILAASTLSGIELCTLAIWGSVPV